MLEYSLFPHLLVKFLSSSLFQEYLLTLTLFPDKENHSLFWTITILHIFKLLHYHTTLYVVGLCIYFPYELWIWAFSGKKVSLIYLCIPSRYRSNEWMNEPPS